MWINDLNTLTDAATLAEARTLAADPASVLLGQGERHAEAIIAGTHAVAFSLDSLDDCECTCGITHDGAVCAHVLAVMVALTSDASDAPNAAVPGRAGGERAPRAGVAAWFTDMGREMQTISYDAALRNFPGA